MYAQLYLFLTAGFVAVAYPTAIFVINMRGPEVIFRRMDGVTSKGKHIIGLHPGRSQIDPITSLVWTISPIVKGDSFLERSIQVFFTTDTPQIPNHGSAS